VICTVKRAELLERCLTGVARLTYSNFEVLIVDNSAGDPRTIELAKQYQARYVHEPVRGVNRARNCGARTSTADLIAYLDDDAIPDPEWLSALTDEFHDPQVMSVTGRILPLKVTTEAERLFVARGAYDSGPQRRSIDRETPNWFEIANYGGMGNETNMAFRRQAFDVWPGFDERIGYGTPLQGNTGPYAYFSLIDRGYRVIYTPHAVVYHPLPQTLTDLRTRHRKSIAAAAAYASLLFFEHPSYRGTLIKYMVGRLRKKPRHWRKELDTATAPLMSRWRELLACLQGPVIYGRSLLHHRWSGDS
jgi:glycosyltransferase involved in cell wall biosynthesis